MHPGRRILLGSTLLGSAVVLTASCGSSDTDGAVSTATTATTVPVTTSATTTTSTTTTTTTTMAPTTTPTTSVPATFAEAATARLTSELGDAGLAAQLVERLGPDTLAQMESQIGIAGAADSLLLALAAPTAPASDLDSVVVYAFGNRVLADGALQPGPVNQALAEVTAAFVRDHPVPVYAQWEVADLLIAAGVPNVTSIGRDVDPTGAVVYLSTAGVAAKAVELAAASGGLGHVGVIGFADHAVRCVLTSRAAGMTADVPADVELPSEYDAESGQSWTTNRLDYLSVDLAARLAVWT